MASPEPPTIAPIPPAQPGKPSDREEETEVEVEVEQEYEVERREEEKKPSNPEQEHQAILKMIAEGHITPPSWYPQKHQFHVLTDRDQP